MAETEWTLYNIMHHIIGNAPGMIYGPTGSGKSMLTRSVIQSAVKQGIKAAVCDTEANYMEEDTEWLKAHTKYANVDSLQDIIDWVRGVNMEYKLIVVDSVGGPAYGQYVEADRKRSGETFKKIAHVSSVIQQRCLKNGAMAIVINQPTSDFAGATNAGNTIAPFGGKSGFYSKEVIETVPGNPKDGWSISVMKIYKSRHMKLGQVIGEIGISDDKVAVKFKPYQGRRSQGYPETRCVIPNPAMGSPVEKEEPHREEPENPVEKGENEEEYKEPENTTEIPIDEESEPDASFVDGGEELTAIQAEIAKMMEEKGIGDIQFKAIMKSKQVDVEFAAQINDLDTANAVKDVLENFGQQKG